MALSKFILTQFVQTRCLAALPAFSTLGDDLKDAWARACEVHAPLIRECLDRHLDHGDVEAYDVALSIVARVPLELVGLTNLRSRVSTFGIEDPSRGGEIVEVAVPGVGDSRADPGEDQDEFEHIPYDGVPLSPDEVATVQAKSAASAARANRPGVAFQRMLSPGSTPATKGFADKTAGMHRKRNGVLRGARNLPRNVPQLAISPEKILRQIRDRAGTASSSIGPLGWSEEFFLPLRFGTDGVPDKDTFIWQVARMLFIAVRGKVSKLAALLLTAGKSTSLFKDPPEVRMDQAADDQRVRPIVAGTVLLKFILKGALADPTGQRVLKVLSKHNKALGTSGGPEMVVFESSAQYESGAAISTTDMTNAFNEFDSEHLFESITELWPESFCLWAFIYGIDSLIFFQYYDQSTGRLIFMFIWCQVGSKMGCTWGSIAIGLVLHLFVYGPLNAEFASHEAISITDDSFAFLRPTAPNESGWQEAYRMHATYIERFTELANVVGLDFNWSKPWLLLPAGAPRPDADAGLPGGLQITWSGIVVAGAPVGTVAFKQQHATAFFDGLSYRINGMPS